MRYIPAVTLYIRLKNPEGKYAFEPVAGLSGRKPRGRYYLRHTNEKGKQKWVPLEKGLAYQDAIAERDSFSAGLLATRHGLNVAEMEDHVARVAVKDAVAAFLNAKAHKKPRTLQAYRHTLNCFVESLPTRVRFVDEIDAGVLKAFQDGMARQKPASKTIRNRMLIVSFLLKHAAVGVKVNWQNAPIVEKQPVRTFNDAELRKLFDACKRARGVFVLSWYRLPRTGS